MLLTFAATKTLQQLTTQYSYKVSLASQWSDRKKTLWQHTRWIKTTWL